MACAAVDALGVYVQGGLVVAPDLHGLPAPLVGVVGQHPQPGPGSEDGGRRALALASAMPIDAELFVLISGGASSLMAVPAPGLRLEDKRDATGVLLRSGADIYALNTVRKHMSGIKGGRLAAACPSDSHTFVLSDVVGDDLSFIASGPTVPDPTTYGDALFVIDRFGGREAFPPPVIAQLLAGARGELPESPKPGDARLARAHTELVGGRHDAMRGAAADAEACGYTVVTLDAPIVGEARLAGADLARRVIAQRRVHAGPLCVIASGETTVRVIGRGRGGRNQELALAAAEVLAELTTPVAAASIGTDGIDGPTDAAGAIVDATTITRALRAGLSPAAILANNNSYALFDAIGDLVRTGPSGTNVGDLHVFLLA